MFNRKWNKIQKNKINGVISTLYRNYVLLREENGVESIGMWQSLMK